MKFDPIIHNKAWDSLKSFEIDPVQIKPIGRAHNGLEEVLDKLLTDKYHPYLVLEIGSELGGSTRFFCEYLPNCDVICIDPWPDGYKMPKEFTDVCPELKDLSISSLYQLFLYFCRNFKERILPIRSFSNEGVVEIYKLNFVPDIVYVDGDHRYFGVIQDLIMIHNLFPSTLIVGDDWNFTSKYSVYKGIEKSVQKAAVDFSDHFGLQLEAIKNTYAIIPDLEQQRIALNYTTSKPSKLANKSQGS